MHYQHGADYVSPMFQIYDRPARDGSLRSLGCNPLEQWGFTAPETVPRDPQGARGAAAGDTASRLVPAG
jgi:hypothetical protein